MRVILISGKAQHGKDTTARILKDELELHGDNVLIAHYADLVKYICRTFFWWDGNKDEYGRHLLQYVGTDVIRQEATDYWVDFLSDILHFFPDEWDVVIIPDARFPNEIERMKMRGHPVTHIRVVRENFESPLTEEQQHHESEVALDNVEPDVLFKNNGNVNDLVSTIQAWIKENIYE